MTLELNTDNDIEDDVWDIDEYDWEDSNFPEHIKKKFPGYTLVKMSRYNADIMKEMMSFLEEYCENPFERVGWYSNCAYSVGVAFEDSDDALQFVLRYECNIERN